MKSIITNVFPENFQVIGNRYSDNNFKPKLLEAILIKEPLPTMNTREVLVAWKLS